MADNLPSRPGSSGSRDIDERYERIDTHYFTHMSQTQADAMIQVSKNEHVIPARHETYRAYGPIILVGILLIFLIPQFLAANPDAKTLAYLIAGVIGIVAAGPTAKAVIEALRRS
ncbi:MAG: hypothetical protein WCA22_20425 [Candidatus Binatus sp.]